MSHGAFTLADIDQSAPPPSPGKFTAADIDPPARTQNQQLGDQIYNLVGNAAKSLAKVSGPNIMYELFRKHFPQAKLPPAMGMPNENEIMQAGLLSMIPEAEGEFAAEGAAPKAAAKAAPSAASTATSALEHPAVTPWIDAAKAEAMKIPGAHLAKTIYDSARGLTESAPTAEVPPPAVAVPETNGIPWGTRGPGPLDLRGKMIPTEAPTEVATPPAAVSPKITRATVEQQLNDALGGRPLKPGVPLKNQTTAATAKLPEGFTPVDSSALRGYKYSPDTREFESITQGGHYIHGDVSPEEAQAFADAASKGKAWQQIRQNPLVAKVVNGKRVSTIPTKQTVSATAAKPQLEAAADDLSAILQESLKQARERRPNQ